MGQEGDCEGRCAPGITQVKPRRVRPRRTYSGVPVESPGLRTGTVLVQPPLSLSRRGSECEMGGECDGVFSIKDKVTTPARRFSSAPAPGFRNLAGTIITSLAYSIQSVCIVVDVVSGLL